MNKQLDITGIAQKLLDELHDDELYIKGRKDGVKELHERLVQEIKRIGDGNKPGGPAQTQGSEATERVSQARAEARRTRS